MLKNKFKIRTNQKNKLKGRRPRYWILSVTAVGILVAYTVGESRALNVAHIKENQIFAEKSAEKLSASIHRFNIPAGTLEEVLTAFEKVSGWRIVVPDEIKPIASMGVAGDYTDEQALKQILQNTGVTYGFTAPNEVTLKLPGP